MSGLGRGMGKHVNRKIERCALFLLHHLVRQEAYR
jgi:hypothetical protein